MFQVRHLLSVTSSLLIVILSILYLLTFRVALPAPLELNFPKRILVIAPHADDDVIMAGGLLPANSRQGGANRLVVVTREGDPAVDDTRRVETHSAWSVLKPHPDILFWNIVSERSWAASKESHFEMLLNSELDGYNPEVVVYPLLEGGNFEHDTVSRLVSKALAARPEVRALPGAGYNSVYCASSQPEKLLRFFFRLFPFIGASEANTGLDPNNQLSLPMTTQGLMEKIEKLRAYSSQAGVIPVSQFGVPDLFDHSSFPPCQGVFVGQKYFSPMALVFLVLSFFWMTLAGARLGCGMSISRLRGALIFLLLVLLAEGVGKGTRFLVEEYTFVIAGLVGGLLNLVYRFQIGRSKS